jgi:DNA-binding GntR family transcriptional regulator
MMSHLWCSHENQYCNAQAANNVASTTKQVNERDKAFTFILATLAGRHVTLSAVVPLRSRRHCTLILRPAGWRDAPRADRVRAALCRAAEFELRPKVGDGMKG